MDMEEAFLMALMINRCFYVGTFHDLDSMLSSHKNGYGYAHKMTSNIRSYKISAEIEWTWIDLYEIC